MKICFFIILYQSAFDMFLVGNSGGAFGPDLPQACIVIISDMEETKTKVGWEQKWWTQIDIKSQVMPAFTIFRFHQQIQTLHFVFYLFLLDCFPNSPMQCNDTSGQVGLMDDIINGALKMKWNK